MPSLPRYPTKPLSRYPAKPLSHDLVICGGPAIHRYYDSLPRLGLYALIKLIVSDW